jgi:hypothetical protein
MMLNIMFDGVLFWLLDSSLAILLYFTILINTDGRKTALAPKTQGRRGNFFLVSRGWRM